MAEKIKVSTVKDNKAEKKVIMKTGFRNLDTALGYRMYDQNTNELIQVNRGFLSGGIVTVIGKSHTGKSSLCAQMAANSIKSFIRAGDTRVKIHFFDTEGGIDRNRYRVLSKLNIEQVDEHIVFEPVCTIEEIKKCIKEDILEKSEKGYQFVKTVNHMGQPIEMYHPTVLLVDSISKIITDKVEDIKNDTTNAMYMQVAGEIDRFLKQMLPTFAKYNITMICTAHTGTKIDPNSMYGPKKAWRYLPASLDIKAPDSVIYDCSLGINLETILAANPEQVENKCSASYLNAKSIIEGRIYKSRQPGEGATFCLVQDEQGFDPERSFIYECQYRKILQSKPGSRELDGYGKVQNNKILETFKTNKDFRRVLYLEFDKLYEDQLESSRLSKEDVELSNTIYDLMNEEFD